jgi:hypothetical protein
LKGFEMAYEMRPGSGSLFKNDKKTEERHPNLKGKVMLPNGEVRWLSAWTKKTAAGDTWLSLSVGDLVQGVDQPKPVAVASAGFNADDDSDIPF